MTILFRRAWARGLRIGNATRPKMADAALADGVGYSFHTWRMSCPTVSSMPPVPSREIALWTARFPATRLAMGPERPR